MITIDPTTLLWVPVIYDGAQPTENQILTLGILDGLGLPIAAATLILIPRLHADAQTAGSE